MSLNHAGILAQIRELATTLLPVALCMRKVIEACSRDVPHRDWESLLALPYDDDVLRLSPWIHTVFERDPSPFEIEGLWVGIGNFGSVNGPIWSDMYLGALGSYAPEDDALRWLFCKKRHYPAESNAQSEVLRRIYEVAHGTGGGLGVDAEWPLCLAFAAFAVRSLLAGKTPSILGSEASRVGVVVGFDDGDFLKLGELTAGGFAPGLAKTRL